MKTLLLWICGLLSISLTGAQELDVFPENFKVVKLTNETTLRCDASDNVKWKFEDKVKEGPNLTITNTDLVHLGKYTCWRGGEMIYSTYLLQEDIMGGDFDSLIKCRAKSYDCNFTCKRTTNAYTLIRLGLGPDCWERRETCHWVSIDSSQQPQEEEFQLVHTLSPYAEEHTKLELTVEAINVEELSIVRREKKFYLRDIVQPDSPQIVKCQEVACLNRVCLNVTIEPPSTWSAPHSFFSLQHEIEYQLNDDGKIENSSSTVIPRGITKLRVRSRDSLVVSAWSQWTPWKNVRTGKKNHAANACCPELPSEYLDSKEGGKAQRKRGIRHLRKKMNKNTHCK